MSSARRWILASLLWLAIAPSRAGAQGTGSAAAPTPSTSASASASALEPPKASPAVPWSTTGGGDTREGLDPLPSTGQYLSYGAAFHSEALLAPGNVCPKFAEEACVLGGGGGISFGGAYRTNVYSLGGAYEASFHDSSAIYQRGVLQQLRGEWRYRPRLFAITDSITAFVGAGGGLAGYGDNWSISTLGGAGHLSLGAEFDLGTKVAVVFATSYRAIYFRAFDDASGQHRPAGLVHLLGFQLGLELHDPI